MAILPDFCDDHWSLQRESQLARFPRQILVLQPKLSAVRVRLGLKNGLSTRIVPEPGLLCLKWKIQLEENTTSHSPEHVAWRYRRERFIKLAGYFRQTGSWDTFFRF